jgi:1-deoxy-D-xylulose-5-phosphate synthase
MRDMMLTMIEHVGPVAMRYPRGNGIGVPIDRDLIVTVEEAYLAGGFGSAVLELLEENGLQDKVRVVRMGVPDRIVTHGDAKLLLAKYGLDADGIYTRVKESLDVLEGRRAKHRKVTA